MKKRKTKKTTGALLMSMCLYAGVAVAQPVISSMSTYNGPLGGPVLITGDGFNTDPANNIVRFGGVKANVTSASATSLQMTIPAGALFAPVDVHNTITGKMGSTNYPFLPTFDNSAYEPNTVNFLPYVEFGATVNYLAGVAIGDIDGDNKPDVVVSHVGPSSGISVFRNTSIAGTINSSSFQPGPFMPCTGQISAPVLADVDLDGKLDVIVRQTDRKLLTIYHNSATPGVIDNATFHTKIEIVTTGYAQNLAVGDINNDGKPDIVTVGNGTLEPSNTIEFLPSFNGISVLRNTSSPGDPSFAKSMDISMPNTVSMTEVAIGDMDNDGRKDIVSAAYDLTEYTGRTYIFKNTSDPSTMDASTITQAAVLQSPYSNYSKLHMNLVDWDGDDKLDILASGVFTPLDIFRNIHTSGSALSSSSFDPAYTTNLPGEPAWLAFGDLDGDNKPDMLVSVVTNAFTYPTKYVHVIRNTATTGAAFDPSSFAYPVDFAVKTTATDAGIGIAIGDLDGDGKPDIAATESSNYQMKVLRNAPLYPITGNKDVCRGSTTTLSNAIPGGTWFTQQQYSTASVNATTGVVTGLSQGTALISYTMPASYGGKVVTTTVTVLPWPNLINGPEFVCAGTSATFTNGAPGSTWSSSNTAIATVGSASGMVTGVTQGIVTISCAMVTTGCVATKQVTVNSTPGPIGNNSIMCPTGTLTLSNSMPGGLWSSSNTSVVWFPTNAQGNCKAISVGTATVAYTSCGVSSTAVVTVAPASAPIFPTATSVCAGTEVKLNTYYNNTYINSVSAIPFTSYSAPGSTLLASDDGSVSVPIPFTFTLFGKNFTSLFVNANGFVSFGSGTAFSNFTAKAMPSVNAPINGSPQAMIALFWHDMNSTSVGTITKAMIGTAPNRKFVISYNAVGDYTGSGTNTGQLILHETTNLIDVMIGSTGFGALYAKTCGVQNGEGTLGVAAPGQNGDTYNSLNTGWRFHGMPPGATYVWTPTSSLNVPTIHSPIATPPVGTTTYSLSMTAPGCNLTGTTTVTAIAAPSITGGAGSICLGASTTLTATPSGGFWTTSTPSVVTVGFGTGVVNSVSAGTAGITYLWNTCPAVKVVSVLSTPAIGTISGATVVPVGTTAAWSCTTPGGTWSSANSSIASVGPASGIITGVTVGTTDITYTLNNGCGTNFVKRGIRIVAAKPGVPAPAITETEITSISLFPNPNNGTFTLQTPVSGAMAIHTIDGRVVQRYEATPGSNACVLPTGLAAGIYMCRFMGEDGTEAIFRLVYQQ